MVFLSPSALAQHENFADELTLEGGYIVTQGTGHHAATATNIEGVFAAGDCQDPVYRQAVTSAATGAWPPWTPNATWKAWSKSHGGQKVLKL